MIEHAGPIASCGFCKGAGLVEASAWRWQADRWLPCPAGCLPPPMKPYTKYECLNPCCGKSSVWTGSLGTGRRRGDHLCTCCGVAYTELVLKEFHYRVEWEMRVDAGSPWRVVRRETNSLKSATDQAAQLSAWELSGEEQIRNVRMVTVHHDG